VCACLEVCICVFGCMFSVIVVCCRLANKDIYIYNYMEYGVGL